MLIVTAMRSSNIITGQYVVIEQYPASAADRLLARMIDMFILQVYLAVCLSALMALPNRYLRDDMDFILIVALLIPVAIYFPVCELLFAGQTIGKRIQRIRVVQADGSRLRLSSALLRWTFDVLDVSLALGLPVIILSKKSQRIGDIAANTIVIKDSERFYADNNPYAYDFADKNYHPTYPEASELTVRQYELIDRVIYYDGDFNRHMQLLDAMANKVIATLGIMPRQGMPANQFLATVLSDYRYYASLPDLE